jgi:hypothetical protein
MIFGSTTERVLRQTTIPVIVIPSHDPGPDSLDIARLVAKGVRQHLKNDEPVRYLRRRWYSSQRALDSARNLTNSGS